MWFVFFFFKQKTEYDMRISDWSSDVCSSDLLVVGSAVREVQAHDIDARGEHAAQHRGLVGRRAEGGNNLGAADHGIPGSPNTISVGARRAIGSVIETGFGEIGRAHV